MFVGTYYLRLFNAHAMILIFHIFMNVNKLCLITINLELLDQNVKYIYMYHWSCVIHFATKGQLNL